jgi:PTS system nitrogen regulatory IIA component
MNLRDFADRDRIVLDVAARDVMDALQAAAAAAAPRLQTDVAELVAALLTRERLGSTAVGMGFAIPHGKVKGVSTVDLSLVRFAAPVDFGAPDDSPVRFLFVVFSPPEQPTAHLKILSQIARVLKRGDLRQGLLAASDRDEVLAALRSAADAEGL